MGAYADLLADIGQPSSGGSVQVSPGIEGFIKAYSPQAERVAAQTGNDPALYLAQWGLETGWGKSIIPGTNNLGNIKDFSGSGVAARDNMTGSRDKYRQYDTPDAFADDFAGLLSRRYKGALNVGNDPVAFASALKQNGYAEDPAYVSKIKAAHNLVSSRYSGQPASIDGERTEPRMDFSSLGDRYGRAPSSTLEEQAKADAIRASIDKGRSFGESIGDTGASALKGIGNFGESMGGLYGLATGNVDPNVVQTGGKALADFAESLKSDFIKNKERLSQQDIDAAEGHFNKFATAAWSNMSDPALFVNFLAEQAINFVPGMAAGRLAKGIIAGLGGASAAAIEAAPLAQKAMLMKRLETAGQIGTGVSVATGAVLQGADAGNSAYQQVMGRPQTEWDANPDYQRLVTTHGMDGAKQQIALQEARTAFAKSAVLSAGLNSFAPAHSIDKILVNGLKNKALTTAGREVVEKAAGQTLTRAAGTGAVKGFLGESASEALDEGYSQYAANEAEAAVNPNKDLLDDVAQNAGLGAAFGPIGAVTGGIDGASRRKSAQELLQIATQQAAAQPNSPLSRAAAAAGPAVQASEQVAAEQAAATDPLAEQVAAIGDRLNDRAIYDAIRSHENLGPQALSDILGAYRVASNFNLDIKQRQAAVERLNNFFQLFDNQPNFTMGANGEAEQGGPLVPAGRGGENRRQESNVPTYDVGAPALGYQRRGDTLTDERAKQVAAAEYEQAYQDLVKAEQLGAGDQELMQRQIALRQAEDRLQEIQRTIDGNRQLDSAANRDALLGDVLAALPPGQNPNRAFDRALRNAGFNETQFSEAERAKIAQWQQLSDGFMQQDAEPSRPNEMDAAALGIKEKQAAQAPANPNLAKVDAMINAGMQRKGDKMFDPRTGKSVKLSPAQIARAKHVERQNDRNRVMPAYQRAIEQRTRELEQLLSDPNHDEAAAVRLARGLSGLKQMVEQLQRGASLDEAIGNVFGRVGSQFANQLKNPAQRNDDAGDAPVAVESAPQPKAPRGGGRLTPLQDERLAQYGDDLQAMAGDAGWAEEGVKLIRNDDGTMSRTRWIPRAEWFVAGMLNNPQASEEAVRKALAGEPMYRAEKLHVMGMMDFLDAQQASREESAFIESLDSAISEDSDFGLPDYSAETAAVIELEFAQGSADVPAFLEAIGANDEKNDVTQDAAGAGQAGGAATGKPQEDGQAGQDAPGAGRAGSQSQGFGLTGQTNEQAAAEYAQQQAEQPADITKAQADKERDAVPFSLAQQSQPKPQGVQGGLFTADGRASVAAKQEDQKPFDEADRAKERQALYEKTRAEAQANPLRTEELSKVMPAFDAETERLRKAANQNTIKNETPSVSKDSGVSVGKNQASIKKADRRGAEDVTAPKKSEASNSASPFKTVSEEFVFNDAKWRIDVHESKFEPGTLAWTGYKNGVKVNESDIPLRVAKRASKFYERVVDGQSGDLLTPAVNSESTQKQDSSATQDADADKPSDEQEAGNDGENLGDLSDAHPEPAKTGLDKAADAIDAKIDDVAARLAAKFKASRGTLNSGVDPELLMLGAELGSLYIAKGVVKFAQYARAVLDKMKEFGIDAEEVKPMLKKFYLASQDGVDDATFDQMDDPRTVRNFDLDSLDAADSIQDKIAAAEQATNHDATPAQKEAGNYAKGKFPWNGLTISVETAKGEDRTDKETNGEKWRVTMPATYGYILRTTGADGDHVDAFMGPNPESDKVFVINQTQAGSEKFDEHKVMLGYPSERAAKADYLASFSDGFGRKVFGSIEGPFSVDEFRRMLDDGEFERKQEIDFGRRLNERTPLSDITVTVDAVEAETGRTVEMDENAADALKDVDDRMKLARSLLECLAS